MTRSVSSSSLRSAAQIGATLVIAAGLLLAITYNGHRNWIAPLVAATIVSVFSAAASMLVISFALRDPRLLPSAALGATLVRASVSLVGGVIAVLQFGLAAPPTLLMVLAYYLALLIVECAILYRSFNLVKEL